MPSGIPVLALLPSVGPTELIVILLFVLIFFGAAKLPQAGQALGLGIKNFKKSMTGDDDIDVTPKKKKKTKAIAAGEEDEEDDSEEEAEKVAAEK